MSRNIPSMRLPAASNLWYTTPMQAGNDSQDVFGAARALVGMLHLPPLPGSPGRAPRGGFSLDDLLAAIVAEAELYQSAGFTALMIENMHDRPYLKAAVGPETVAAMACIGREVQRAVPLPLGVQVLAGANREAVAVALACGAEFVRVEGFVFAHVADEGLIESDAGSLLRYRTAIGADHVRVFADIKKKHSSHALTADLDVAETARAAEFALADGLIVTGAATGKQAAPDDVREAATAVGIPVLVGSGITAENIDRYPTARGFIVGSAVKQGGDWRQPVDPDQVKLIADAFHALAEQPR
jgi:membrane complex biogenesis BtpA family protein